MSAIGRGRWWPGVCGSFLLAGLVFLPAADADVVVGKVLPMWQPDGVALQVRIWGDEFYTVVESLDGYTLVRDPQTQFICYARLSDDGNRLISSGVTVGQADPAGLGLTRHLRIHPAAAAAQARAARADFEARRWEGFPPGAGGRGVRGPSIGAVQGICLIIDFSDSVGTIPPAAVAAYCNQVGYKGYGNNGSVRDYFYDVSGGLLTYTNFVPSAYYRAKHPKTYYTDPNVPYGQRARELILEALVHLDDSGFDFSQYDADQDGIVDALNCYYAGYSNSAWAQGLWPHAWTVYFCADGVCTEHYQMTDMQNALRLSTFCHENGHMLLGWPDLYDYDYDSTGVGQFCLMAYGTTDTNPCQPSAYMKYIAGWTNTAVLAVPQVGLVAPATGNVVYKYPHPKKANEYYLIENRQKLGRDAELPDAGLAIWHIDTQGSNNNQQMTPELHYLVSLVQADACWHLEHNMNYGDVLDLYGAPSYTECSPITWPNTHWWDTTPSGLWITDVSEPAAVMTFNFYAPGKKGDLNCDGVVDFNDIDPFVLALTYPGGYAAAFPDCDIDNGDINQDGLVDFNDISPFVALLTG